MSRQVSLTDPRVETPCVHRLFFTDGRNQPNRPRPSRTERRIDRVDRKQMRGTCSPASDLSAHLLYGTVTAATLRLLSPLTDTRVTVKAIPATREVIVNEDRSVSASAIVRQPSWTHCRWTRDPDLVRAKELARRQSRTGEQPGLRPGLATAFGFDPRL